MGSGRFLFLGQEGLLNEIGWDGPQREKLWRYNQHYFDDLNAVDGLDRTHWHQFLLKDWVENNPPGQGNAWEPYPTSLRIVNWVKWAFSGNPLPHVCVDSLAIQARWLTKRLEKHLLGNHLFANAKALFFAGCFFEGDQAESWRRIALGIIEREIPEQILLDGGHFERSTMYHVLAVEDMLDLCNLARVVPTREVTPETIQRWQSIVADMLSWLALMSHPDQKISFFNDAAFGIAPSNSEIFEYSERLGLPSPSAGFPAQPGQGPVILKDTGYAVAVPDQHSKLIMDVGDIGPDYLPGHAHADTLSFELSVFGKRFLVNSGTSCYGADAERVRQRGTAAHNTVQLDGANSSEVWSGFRVARRARANVELVERSNDGGAVRASHDGYFRLPGKNLHRREWRFSVGGLLITDTISGAYDDAVARFRLHPDVEASELLHRMVLYVNDRPVRLAFEGAAEIQLVPSTWHPGFGESMVCQCLEVSFSQGKLTTNIEWGEQL